MSTTSTREVLQAIYDEAGDLTPDLVVYAARKPDHPLHNRFEWDDRIAGPLWRREQASNLIRSVRIKFKDGADGPSDLRAFVAVKGEDSYQSSYTPVEKAMEDPFARRLVLRQMRREWQAMKKRYEHMREFSELIRADLEGEAS